MKKQTNIQVELRQKTKDTLYERGADYVLNLTDALYPLALGAWAVFVSSVASAFLNLTGAIYTGINVAVLTLVAKHLGAGNKERARAYLNQSLLAIGIIGVVLGSVIAIFPAILLEWQGVPSQAIQEGVVYFQVVGGCYFVMVGIRWNLAVSLRSVGDTKSPKRASLLMCALNLVFDPLLIFVAGWGLMGSAWGSIIARVIGIGYLWLCFRRNSELSHIQAGWRLTWDIQKELFQTGVPIMANQSTIHLVPLLLNRIIMELGVAALAAYRIWMMVRPPLIDTPGLAAGTTLQTEAAKLIGEAKADPTRTASLRQEYTEMVEICMENSVRLVKYGLAISFLLILLVAFVYMPLVDAEAESSWYLLTFFGTGIVCWFYGSKNAVLEIGLGTLRGWPVLKAILLSQSIRILLCGLSVLVFSSVVYLGVISVVASFTISTFILTVLLRKISHTVLQ